VLRSTPQTAGGHRHDRLGRVDDGREQVRRAGRQDGPQAQPASSSGYATRPSSTRPRDDTHRLQVLREADRRSRSSPAAVDKSATAGATTTSLTLCCDEARSCMAPVVHAGTARELAAGRIFSFSPWGSRRLADLPQALYGALLPPRYGIRATARAEITTRLRPVRGRSARSPQPIDGARTASTNRRNNEASPAACRRHDIMGPRGPSRRSPREIVNGGVRSDGPVRPHLPRWTCGTGPRTLIRTWCDSTPVPASHQEFRLPAVDRRACRGGSLYRQQEMSKFESNVVTPRPMVDQFGADARPLWLQPAVPAPTGVDEAR